MTEASGAPPGFVRHFRRSVVTDPWEPLWSRRDGDVLHLGVRVAASHCNARGRLHGGVVATLADAAMGLACAAAMDDSGMVTVNLSVDYYGAGEAGQWLEIVARPGRSGRTLSFATADITADGIVIGRASGVFRTIIKE